MLLKLACWERGNNVAHTVPLSSHRFTVGLHPGLYPPDSAIINIPDILGINRESGEKPVIPGPGYSWFNAENGLFPVIPERF